MNPPKVHFHHRRQEFTSCGVKIDGKSIKQVSSHISEVNCLNCLRKYERDKEANLRTVEHVIHNKVMGEAEIMSTLKAAFTDVKTMSERNSGIAGICGLIEYGVLTNQELIDAFKEAFIRQVMEA